MMTIDRDTRKYYMKLESLVFDYIAYQREESDKIHIEEMKA